jgi:hypothetical protein
VNKIFVSFNSAFNILLHTVHTHLLKLEVHIIFSVLKTLATASQAYPTCFSLEIVSFYVLLPWVSTKSQLILSSCAYFSPFQVLFSILFIRFNVLLTIRILTLLGICF